MRRARSVTGPLRRAHPASGATWNVQVVRGKMSSQCLWHACRALSAGLLLMLLGAAMAVIGYYADFLSVDQEVRGNATVSVKDEARGFHLNNLSYVGPIVMGFGGFIVVAACVMTFEARDSAAKVTPARPTALPRPLPRRGPPCAAPARLDQLGVYRLPHVLPLPRVLPLAPLHRHRPAPARNSTERGKGNARFGSAPDLRSGGGSGRAALPVSALRRPLRRYAVSVDEPHHQTAASASAAGSECGSQSSLALDLHGSGACAGVTLRVRDNTRRRPLARQQRLRDETVPPTPIGSTANVNDEVAKTSIRKDTNSTHLSVENELRACSAPPTNSRYSPGSPTPPSPPLITSIEPDTCDSLHLTERQQEKPNKQEYERQANTYKEENDIVKQKPFVLIMGIEDLINKASMHLRDDRCTEDDVEERTMADSRPNDDGTLNGNDDDTVPLENLDEPLEEVSYQSLYDISTQDELRTMSIQEVTLYERTFEDTTEVSQESVIETQVI